MQSPSLSRRAGTLNNPLVFAGILFLLMAIGLSNLSLTEDASSAMLPTDSDFHERYADYLERFPSDHIAIIVTENLFCSEEGWDLIVEMDDLISRNDIVDRTASVASENTRYLQATADFVDLAHFRDVEFNTAKERCDAADRYKPYRGSIANNGQKTATYVVFNQNLDAVKITQNLQGLLKPIKERAEALGGRVVVTGEPIMSAEVSSMVARDTIYVILTLLAMLGTLAVLTRSGMMVITSLITTIFTVVGAYGTMGWLNIELTPATSLAVFLLIPLSAAVCIYVRAHVASLNQEDTPVPKSRNAFLVAGATTAIGFSSTGWTDALDIQHMAILGTLGVVILTAGAFLVAFPLLSREEPKGAAFKVTMSPPIRLISNSLLCFFVFAVLLGFIGYGISNVKVNYGPTNYIPEDNSIRKDFDEIGESFGRMALPFVLETENAESPEPWVTLEPLISRLSDQYGKGFEAAWFYDHLSEVTKGFTLDEDGNVLAFPDNADLMAQLFILFDPEDLALFVDNERERILVVFHVPFEGSADYYEFKELVVSHMESEGLKGHFVGRVSAFFEAGHNIGFDTLRGLSVGALLVLIVLWILLKSFRIALIGVLVNAIPVLIAIGALGALNIDLDLGSSIVAAVAFGIILDDTAHLIFRMRELMRSGYDSATAVVTAVSGLSTPIFATTCAVSIGFACLFFAEMIPFGDFAAVMLIAMWGALITDLLLLPFFVRVAFDSKTVFGFER